MGNFEKQWNTTLGFSTNEQRERNAFPLYKTQTTRLVRREGERRSMGERERERWGEGCQLCTVEEKHLEAFVCTNRERSVPTVTSL